LVFSVWVLRFSAFGCLDFGVWHWVFGVSGFEFPVFKISGFKFRIRGLEL